MKATRKAVLISVFTFFIIYSIRLIFIRENAIDLPWADQWDGEIERLYFKLMDGTINLSDLWAQANEHHIILTKLLNITSYYMNGMQFNQIFSLYFQTFIFAFIPSVIIYIINRENIKYFETVLVFIITLPIFDWENFYWSYQSQVYFAILFGVLGAYFVSKEKISWVTIFLITLMAGISNATAFYIPILAAISSFLTIKNDKKEISKIIFYLIMSFISYLLFAADQPGHKIYQAHSFQDMLYSFIRYSSYPKPSILGVIIWVILSFYSINFIINNLNKKEASSLERFGFFLSLWFFAFLTSTIFLRAGFPSIPNRYHAYYLIGMIALVCLMHKHLLKFKFFLSTIILLVSIFNGYKSHIEWVVYAEMKLQYRKNFIEALKLAHRTPHTSELDVSNQLKKLPLPYAGYPNYEVPLRIIEDKRSAILFNYLIDEK